MPNTNNKYPLTFPEILIKIHSSVWVKNYLIMLLYYHLRAIKGKVRWGCCKALYILVYIINTWVMGS